MALEEDLQKETCLVGWSVIDIPSAQMNSTEFELSSFFDCVGQSHGDFLRLVVLQFSS